MGDPVRPSSHSHLAFTSITNIKNYVHVTLDFTTTNFTIWSRYFTLLVTRLRLTDYLDGSLTKKSDDDLDWIEFDAQIQTWILTFVSPNMARILISSCKTAASMWTTVNGLFHDHKKARAMDLNNQFTHTKKGTRSISNYCQVLKDIYDNLANLEAPKTEVELVLQILDGLPKEYETLVDLIPMQVPFPTFLQARSLLLLRESRIVSSGNSDDDSHALSVHSSGPPHFGSSGSQSSSSPRPTNTGNQGEKKSNKKNNQRGKQGNQPRGNDNNQARPQDTTVQQLIQALHGLLQQPHGGTATPAHEQQSWPAATQQELPPPLAALMHQLQASQSTPSSDTWYMDSGASNHLVSNSGSQDQAAHYQVQ